MYMKIISMLRGLCRSGAAAVAVLLLLSGCGSGSSQAGQSTRADGGLQIVTAFYPFQFLAEQIGGPNATVISLTAPGAEPHDLELTPRQVASISSADLVIMEKSFQPAVDEAVAQNGGDNIFDTTTVVPLVSHGAGTEDEHAAGEDEHAAGEDEHAEGDGHDHVEETGPDPHVWLDPTSMATIATSIAERLADADPSHAAEYRSRADALVASLTELDRAFSTGLQDCARREFVTTHAAFGYLAARYNLVQISVSGLSPDAEPSPARIAAVQDAARDHGVTTVFYETLVSPAVAESMAADLKLRTDVLDPIEGLTDASRGTDYLAVMTSNLTALREANGCS